MAVQQTIRNPNLPDPNNPMGGVQAGPVVGVPPVANTMGAPAAPQEGPGSQQFADLFNPNRPTSSWRDPNAMFSGAGADPQNQADLAVQREFAAQRNAQLGSDASFDADLRRRADETYAEFERTLNPQWETRAREFEQSLIGRGIDPNSEAGQRARADFDRARTDAFSSARRQANADGVALQQQRWQQQFAMGEAERQARLAAMAGAGASMNAADERDFRLRQFNEDVRRYDQGFDFNTGQADFGMLMAMLGMDQNMTGFNNAASGQELNSIFPFMNLIPQGGPAGIDVMNPYNMQMQAQQANAQSANSRNNAFMQTLGTLGSAMIMCDRSTKEEIRQIGTAHNGLPIYAFRYKIGGPTRIGLMADEVEGVNPEAVITVDGIKMVDYEKALV